MKSILINCRGTAHHLSLTSTSITADDHSKQEMQDEYAMLALGGHGRGLPCAEACYDWLKGRWGCGLLPPELLNYATIISNLTNTPQDGLLPWDSNHAAPEEVRAAIAWICDCCERCLPYVRNKFRDAARNALTQARRALRGEVDAASLKELYWKELELPPPYAGSQSTTVQSACFHCASAASCLDDFRKCCRRVQDASLELAVSSCTPDEERWQKQRLLAYLLGELTP